jgi:UDP-N-acetylglucosamine 4-epimerase
VAVADLRNLLAGKKFRWLVTGAAGFIGSNLTECLLAAGQEVVGFDNFSSGNRRNLEEAKAALSSSQWSDFSLVEDTIENPKALEPAMAGVDFVLHHAAFVSVPLSIKDPDTTLRVNVEGFRNVLEAAAKARVRRVVYASSAAVYGSEKGTPAREDRIGEPLSPYASSKRENEKLAAIYESDRGLVSIGLRYFNIFGPRQDLTSGYGAVIPTWMSALLRSERVLIFGDGETTRDFCFIGDVVRTNVRAAMADLGNHPERVFNVAAGRQSSLNTLYHTLKTALGDSARGAPAPEYRDFRPGDVRHSVADTGRAKQILGEVPGTPLEQGIEVSMPWFRQHLAGRQS